LKHGSSFKVLIYPEPPVLRIWNVSKTKQLFVKIKFAPDTADGSGRHEWHAGGWGQWNNERLLGLTSLHERNLWMWWKSRRWWAQHARQFHLYEVTGNQLGSNALLTQSMYEKLVSQWLGQKLVSRVWAGERLNTPLSSTGWRPSGPDSAALRRTVWFGRTVWLFDCES
jgi:hypothetical protein